MSRSRLSHSPQTCGLQENLAETTMCGWLSSEQELTLTCKGTTQPPFPIWPSFTLQKKNCHFWLALKKSFLFESKKTWQSGSSSLKIDHLMEELQLSGSWRFYAFFARFQALDRKTTTRKFKYLFGSGGKQTPEKCKFFVFVGLVSEQGSWP